MAFHASEVLRIESLTVHFLTRTGAVEAVDDVSFSIGEKETYGLVGESGSGKSTIAHAIMGLLQPPGRLVSGEIRLNGRIVSDSDERGFREIRGKQVAMIFQNPRGSLNPVERVGDQIVRIHRHHVGSNKRDAWAAGLSLFRGLGMRDPETVMASYPHELSGGMCQRVMIAMMVIPRPSLLVADEPTTGLDATIGMQVVDLIRKRVNDQISSMLYITHDMGVVADICDSVGVMHAGQLVERGSVIQVFNRPVHPYTRGLLASTLRVDRDQELSGIHRIPGSVPGLVNPPAGCRFVGRCAHATPECAKPQNIVVEPGHSVSCREEVAYELFGTGCA